MAKNTLKKEYKRYVAIIAAIFLLQSVIGTLLFVRYNYSLSQEKYLREKYVNSNGLVYHLRLLSLTPEQYAHVTQFEALQTEEDRFFSIVGGTISEGSLTTGTKFKIYDVEIAFDSNKMSISDAYDLFAASYYPALEKDGDFEEYRTPLLDYHIDKALYGVLTFVMTLAALFVGIFVIRVLYAVLSPSYSFDYGIYMSFGAGLKKLFSLSATEATIINLALILPSSLLTVALSAIIVVSSGLEFRFCAYALPLSLVLSLTSTLVAVFINFRSISQKSPVKLLSSEDNSEVIASPKTSADILSCDFPRGIEKLSLGRFRKYIIKLNAFSLAFSLLFVFASCLAADFEMAESMPIFQYELSFEPTVSRVKVDENGNPVSDDAEGDYEVIEVVTYTDTYDAEMSSFVASINGIDAVYKESTISAYECNSHILIDSKAVDADSGGISVSGDKGFLDLNYYALDDEVAKWIEFCGYTISGSLDDVIENSSMIAISDSLNNHRKIKLKVGDTVKIAVDSRLSGETPDLPFVVDMNDFLADMLDNYDYRYKTYTVGAVISNMPSDSALSVYLPESAYLQITSREVAYDHAKIVVCDDIGEDDLELVGVNLRYATDFCDNLKVTDLDGLTVKATKENKNTPELLRFIAVSSLLVVPIVMSVSLVIFYKKRDSEFESFYALGAVKSDIEKLFRVDALYLSAISVVSFVISASLVSFLIWIFANTPIGMRVLIIGEAVYRFPYRVPVLPLFVGALVTFVGALIGIGISKRSTLKRYGKERGIK